MSALDFINSTDFIPFVCLIIAFFTPDTRVLRWCLAMVALWFIAVTVLVVVQ